MVATPPAPVERTACLPSWDNQRRTLCVGGQVVKQFRVPSLCQEAILVAFEEEGWPVAIDDPSRLPIPSRIRNVGCATRSRASTLNETNSILRFRGDGSGTRVLWELKRTGREIPTIPVREDVRAAQPAAFRRSLLVSLASSGLLSRVVAA